MNRNEINTLFYFGQREEQEDQGNVYQLKDSAGNRNESRKLGLLVGLSSLGVAFSLWMMSMVG